MCFEDDRTGLDSVYLNYSLDGGATWLEMDRAVPTTAGEADAEEAKIACDGGKVWLVWSEERSSFLNDVFVNGGPLP